MNRRDFLQRCAAGVVGAAIASHIPTSWLPGPVRRYGAIEYMRKAWNEYAKLHGEPPAFAIASDSLYLAYQDEITVQRRQVVVMSPYYRVKGLMFKNTLVANRGGLDWSIEFFPKRPIDLQSPDLFAVQV